MSARSESHLTSSRMNASFRTRLNLRKVIRVAIETLDLWWQKYHQRSSLRRLSDAQLKDIGLNREEALSEANKPFWR